MFGQTKTWKVVYHLPPEKQNGGIMGVAFIEAVSRFEAIFSFQQQYSGQFFTIDSCTEVWN